MAAAEEPISLVVFAADDAVHAALVDALPGHTIERYGDVIGERGERVVEGKTFQIFVFDKDRLVTIAPILDRLANPRPRIVMHAVVSSLNADYPRYECEAIVASSLSAQHSVLGPAFEDRIRLVARRGIRVGEVRLGPANGLIAKATIKLEESVREGCVVFKWTGAGPGYPEGQSTCVRLMLELTLQALALSVPESRPTPVPAVPVTHAPPTVTGLIQHIALRDVKGIEHLAWPLDGKAGFHVVLGQNASGKTGLLRAVTAALLSPESLGRLPQSWQGWIRRDAAEAACDVTFGDEAVVSWRIRERSIEKEGHAYGGFSAAYGPFRRFTGGDVEYEREFKEQRALLRHFSLYSERIALSDALKWLQDLEFRRTKQMPEGELLARVVSFINDTGLLPQATVLSRIDPDGVWFRDANGVELPADELSDGYRTVLSLALDLLRHLAAHFEHASLFEVRDGVTVVAVGGIVVIDEVDAHLHPTWQQRIGRWFKEHLPRMQFLVATHSAIVCQAADSVLLLPDPGTGGEARMLTATELDRLRYGDLIDAFGTGVFGDGVTRSEESLHKLQRLAELNTLELERVLDADERAEQRDLRRVLPSTAFAQRVPSEDA